MSKEFYFGDQLEEKVGKLSLTTPMENGVIENFSDMQHLWDYTFENLGVEPRAHSLLLTEPPYNPRPNREKVVEMMFETYQVPSLNISIQGVLALLGQGRTTGLVLDSGEGVTYTMPIFDGFGFNPNIKRLDLAGRDLNVLMAKLLAQSGTSMTTTLEQHHVRRMKEKCCYCALDPKTERAQSVTYKLPDKRKIVVEDERWRCPEALFSPGMAGLESPGVSSLVWETISNCDMDVRRNLLSNVVLSGGSTEFPGFAERLTKELKEKAPSAAQANVKVLAKDQKFAVWIGGQVFASFRGIQDEQWMTMEDYEENGAGFIHQKIAVKFS